MPIRLSGLVSNMDTDAIVKELMSAQSLKKTKVQNKITTTEWMQEKWQGLNTKIYSFYTGSLSKLRTQGSYLAKKAASSNEAKVSVKASTDAVEGSHTIKVNRLASSQYVTSAKLTAIANADGNSTPVSVNTKLTDLGMEAGTTINLDAKNKSYSFDIDESSTVNDFLNAAKSAGLTATFDKNQGRFFISSASSGSEGAFSITTSYSSAVEEKNALRGFTDYANQSTANRAEIDKLILTYATTDDSEKKDAAYNKLAEFVTEKTTRDYVKHLKDSFAAETLESEDSDAFFALNTAQEKAAQEYNDKIAASGGIFSQKDLEKAQADAVAKAASEYALSQQKAFANAEDDELTDNPYADVAGRFNAALEDYNAAVQGESVEDLAGAGLDKLGLTEITYTKDEETGALVYSGMAELKAAGGSLVEASDSEIEYNGAILVGSSNTVTANGLTFTVQDVTAENETVTLTVSKDTQAVYDTIKTFVKEYNELLTELSTAYNAKSSRGYDPLTDEQKEAMTEEQITKWEEKIKDSLLRRDSSLEGIISSMRTSMAGGMAYNGKTYSLSSFGITSKYYTENGKLHIAGDQDDPLVSEDADKLMAALNEDPEAVMSVLTGLAQKLYSDFGDKMKSTSLRSAMNFYNDKQLSKDLKGHNTDLTALEKKLKTIEDNYYKQFTAMEKAMSGLNSQSNSLAAMLGQ